MNISVSKIAAMFCALSINGFSFAGTRKVLAESATPLPFGSMIPRTMKALETSPKERRVPVHILFYGQSITAQKWSGEVGNELKKRYPNAEVNVSNLAIGGITADGLIKVADHDLYPFYPDLVYFLVYGGYKPGSGGYKDGELEEIVANIRRRTTAEIVLATHHVRASKDHNEISDKKVNLEDDEGSEKIRELAKKYGCELVEVREACKKQILDNNLPQDYFVKDGVHLNDAGCEFVKKLALEHFKYVPNATNKWSESMTTVPAKAAADGSIELEFEGNRIDAIAGLLNSGEKPGTAQVLIDGKAPSSIPELYSFSRPSSTKIMWFPTILRVENEKPLIMEDWKVRFDKINDELGKDFDYTVIGSKTGEDGKGNSLTRFVSKSGRVVLDPANRWTVNMAMVLSKKTLEPGFEFNWTVVPHFLDTYTQPEVKDPAKVDIFILAQGLPNGKHMVKIVPNHDGVINIESLRVHNPPLK